jgi:hypothetical protein
MTLMACSRGFSASWILVISCSANSGGIMVA